MIVTKASLVTIANIDVTVKFPDVTVRLECVTEEDVFQDGQGQLVPMCVLLELLERRVRGIVTVGALAVTQ